MAVGVGSGPGRPACLGWWAAGCPEPWVAVGAGARAGALLPARVGSPPLGWAAAPLCLRLAPRPVMLLLLVQVQVVVVVVVDRLASMAAVAAVVGWAAPQRPLFPLRSLKQPHPHLSPSQQPGSRWSKKCSGEWSCNGHGFVTCAG